MVTTRQQLKRIGMELGRLKWDLLIALATMAFLLLVLSLPSLLIPPGP